MERIPHKPAECGAELRLPKGRLRNFPLKSIDNFFAQRASAAVVNFEKMLVRLNTRPHLIQQ